MRPWPLFLFVIATAALATLVVLRLAMPHLVVKTGTGFWLNMGWTFALFFALADWRRVPLGAKAPGGVLIMMSTFATAVVADVVLGLRSFGDEPFGPMGFVILFFGIAAAVGWWIVFRQAPAKD